MKVGEGAFGDVYEGFNINTNEEVAIKLESIRAKSQCLFYESKIYKILKGGSGIPDILWEGCEGDFNIMIMEILGPSLEELFNYCGNRFTVKTTALIADSILERIEFLHKF
jgi:serine/threonine protein kinase